MEGNFARKKAQNNLSFWKAFNYLICVMKYKLSTVQLNKNS